MQAKEHTLAERLGMTAHVSPLRRKVNDLARQCPLDGARCVEDWLVETANSRGAQVVTRATGPDRTFVAPSEDKLSNEELVVAICQGQCLDRPQMLRLAAQLISRRRIVPSVLILTAKRERVGAVLAELARQALHVEASHPTWQAVLAAFEHERHPREPILHWTRLAEPIMRDGRCNAAGWKLVA